jgi:hypothetical protein
VPEATRPLLMRWCPRVAPFDAASLAEALWLAVRSRNSGVWYVSRMLGHQWNAGPSMAQPLEEESCTAFHFLVSCISLSVRW